MPDIRTPVRGTLDGKTMVNTAMDQLSTLDNRTLVGSITVSIKKMTGGYLDRGHPC